MLDGQLGWLSAPDAPALIGTPAHVTHDRDKVTCRTCRTNLVAVPPKEQLRLIAGVMDETTGTMGGGLWADLARAALTT